jgi:FixJ family two-component response regulator
VGKLPLISIVDDDESVRESLQGLIRSVGFAVQGFASADAFINSGHLPSTACLILDVRMPGMRGPELQHWLKASHHDIPTIFITAHGDDEEARARALKDGAVAYLLKPLSEEVVLGAVHEALNRK